MNEPAFPNEGFNGWGEPFKGMTLRDYFAAKALPVCYKFWMEDYYHPDCGDADIRAEEQRDDFDKDMKELIADSAYGMADAMLKARGE